MNRYPLWKNLLIAGLVLLGALYALPNLFGEDPSVQLSAQRGVEPPGDFVQRIRAELSAADIEASAIEAAEDERYLVRLADVETQQLAREVLRREFGEDYTVALNLAPATPSWLRSLGAEPMVLGLDLQGGVHFLMEVDMDAAVRQQQDRFVDDVRTILRSEEIGYRRVSLSDGQVLVRLPSDELRDQAREVIRDELPELQVDSEDETDSGFEMRLSIREDALLELRETALQQNLTTLRNRVDELGVAEPIVQQQGDSRIVVELPGVQDTARAKDILGATATLEYRAVSTQHDPIVAQQSGSIPPGFRLYETRDGRPVLLDKQLIVSGDQLVDARAGFDAQTGSPEVNVTLNSVGAKRMRAFTRDNVGNSMAVVFIERKPIEREVDGEIVRTTRTVEEVISVATIQDVFGRRFRTTGLDSAEEAAELSLLLRAGSLAAPVDIVEERTVGPSLGRDNIEQGFRSVVVGFVLVLIFMALYYRLFGLIADLALVVNFVLLIALLSMLGATLTLPGIAGIVLTIGMAVDANVLIFERIREELRNGNTPQAAIRAGYDKAFSTIADANVTTLIAAIVLFSFGTGPIKGFAVVLSLGIITSMFTAIMGTRALVNLVYGRRRRVQALAI